MEQRAKREQAKFRDAEKRKQAEAAYEQFLLEQKTKQSTDKMTNNNVPDMEMDMDIDIDSGMKKNNRRRRRRNGEYFKRRRACIA